MFGLKKKDAVRNEPKKEEVALKSEVRKNITMVERRLSNLLAEVDIRERKFD